MRRYIPEGENWLSIENDLKNHFYKTIGNQFNRCLEPSLQCKKKGIRAHSIQNSRTLDLLCQDGHVIQLQWHIKNNNPPEVQFKEIGRNKATTFAGLCPDHDRSLFLEIDTQLIDVKNYRHMFLIAYRSILRELHSTLDAAAGTQSVYQKRSELGLDPKEKLSESGIEATFQMFRSWRMYRYKCKYDNISKFSRYSDLIHYTHIIETKEPTIAASVFFGIGKYSGREDIIGVTINVIPQEFNKSLVIISYLREHKQVCEKYLSKLRIASGHYFNYLLSKLLLEEGENFVISPKYFDTWSNIKRNKISHYFQRTLFNHDYAEEDKEFYLF